MLLRLQNDNPVGKIAKKTVCIFVNSAIKIQCQVVKNTLLQTAFSAILPRLLFRRILLTGIRQHCSEISLTSYADLESSILHCLKIMATCLIVTLKKLDRFQPFSIINYIPSV